MRMGTKQMRVARDLDNDLCSAEQKKAEKDQCAEIFWTAAVTHILHSGVGNGAVAKRLMNYNH